MAGQRTVKMALKFVKTWCIPLSFPVLLLTSYYHFNFSHQSSEIFIKTPVPTKSQCEEWKEQEKKWEHVNFTIGKKTELFFKMEDFFWQQHLAKLALPYGIKGSELLLLKILAVTASYKMPANIENLKCRTCVVIGNGYVIKNTSLGAAINNYDVVIRLNDAPVRGYERDVGNKTTLRLFYPESAIPNPSLHNDPDTLLVLVPFKQQDLRWLKEILYDEKRAKKRFWRRPPQIWMGKSSQIRVLDPYFLDLTANGLLQIPQHPKGKGKQRKARPTTGILAVFVALNYCDVVHIAGFGYPEAKNQRQPIHYFGSNTMRNMRGTTHDVSNEAKTLRKLEEAGAIVYLHPHS